MASEGKARDSGFLSWVPSYDLITEWQFSKIQLTGNALSENIGKLWGEFERGSQA